MLFDRDIQPCCAYCKRGAAIDGERVICAPKGIMPATGSCRRFKYDPLKRVPPKLVSADFSHLEDEDFTL